MNNKHGWSKIITGLVIASLNFFFEQNAYAHPVLPDLGDLLFYPFVGYGVGSIIGALLTKHTYVGAIIGAFMGHFIITIAMVGLILKSYDTEFALYIGMIPALISGIVVGFIVNFFRKHRK